MQMYVAEIETTARALGDEAIADALAKLVEWHVVMHQADSGAEAITLTLPAESLEQATSAALALVGRAGFTGKGVSDAAYFLTLAVMLGAIDKGGVEGNGKDGLLLFSVHGHVPIV